MASTARRVLAQALGAFKGGSGTADPSPAGSPQRAFEAGLDGAVEGIKGAANPFDVAAALMGQAGAAVESQEAAAVKASEKADATLVQAAATADANIGNPVAKTPEQILAEAEAAGIAEAMAEAAAQKAAAERAAANAALQKATANAERVKAEAKARVLAKLQEEAKQKEMAIAAARAAEDAEKATARLSEVKDNLDSLVVYLKGVNLNAETNGNMNSKAKNISGSNLDAAKTFLKTNTAKYEREVSTLTTTEAVDAKKAAYEKSLAAAENEITKLKSSLNSSSNSGRQEIVGKLLAVNMAAFVLTTAINRASERRTVLVNAVRAENLKAGAKAVGGIAASVASTAVTGIASFLKTLTNPTRAAEMLVAVGGVALAYFYDPNYLYAASFLALGAAVNTAATAYLKTEPLIATIVSTVASGVGAAAGGILSGLFSKNTKKVDAARMQLRSANAKVKEAVAKGEDDAAEQVSNATKGQGTPCGVCRAIKNSDGKVCGSGRTPGKYVVDGHCVCTMHYNHPPEKYAASLRGGTRRGSKRGLRKTRKYRF